MLGLVRRRAHLVVLVGLCLTLMHAPVRAVAADADWLNKGREFVRICAENMPNVSAAKPKWLAAGFSDGGVQRGSNGILLTWNSRRVAGAVSPEGGRFTGCMVQVRLMSAAEAESVLAPILKSAQAKARQKTHRSNLKEWSGRLGGENVRIGITRPVWRDVAVGGHAIVLERDPVTQ